MSAPRATLGRHLFYDVRLSVNGTLSCASCHHQEQAFSDSRSNPSGATGRLLRRNAMSLVNVAYSSALTWSRPDVQSLEKQVLIPLLSDDPPELGMAGRTMDLTERLRADNSYQALFREAFPGEGSPFTIANVAKAIASFERTIISARSPYDRYRYGGQGSAISDSAKRGEVLFFTDPGPACYRCHGGFNFSDAVDYVGRGPVPFPFHNNGLYNLPGMLSYPPSNPGLYEFTRRPSDVGKFKPPTLRNVALSAPYMHDGSISTLEAAINHYAFGGQKNPNQDGRVRALSLTIQNRLDLRAFLASLTDEQVTKDPRFKSPW